MKLNKYFFFLSFFLSLSPVFSQDNSEIDSLIHELEFAKQDTNEVKLLNLIASKYSGKAEYKKAIPYAKQGKALAKKLDYNLGEALAAETLGGSQGYIGDYSNAIENYLIALQYWEKEGNPAMVANCYRIIAFFHQTEGDLDKSLEFLQLSLNSIEESKDTSMIPYTLWAIGGVYVKKCKEALEEKDTVNANTFYNKNVEIIKKALTVVELKNDSNSIAFYSENLGSFYDKCNLVNEESKLLSQTGIIKNNYFDEVLNCYERSLKINRLINNTLGEISARSNIGKFYKNQGNLYAQLGDKLASKQFYEKAKAIFIWCRDSLNSLGYTHGVAYSSKDVAEVYMKLGNFNEAEKNLNNALQIFKERGFKTGIEESYDLFVKLYEREKDFYQALVYFKKYTAIKDSLVNEESLKVRNNLIARYDLESKERKIELNEAVIKKQNVQKVAIGSGSLLIISLLSVGFLLFRNRRKREKAELTQQLTEIKHQALNAQMSDHFIGNAMDSINSFIENNDKEKASEYLILFSRLVRKVLENSFEQMVPLEQDLDVLENYLELEKLRFKGGEFKYEIIIEEGIDKENVMIPPMVFQVLSENSIKHGFDKSIGGELKIKIEKESDALKCIVVDNGIGRKGSPGSPPPKNRTSIGGGLAEKLIKLSGQARGKSTYKIVDIIDELNNPSGTQVEFTLPYVLAF